ncbi:MAG: hypothetical protein AAFX85_17555, partial [Pseudomonadota bacterium]
MTDPRPTSLARDGTASVNRQRWPLVLLPGILGTRLQYANSNSHFWDPDSNLNLAGLATSRRETLRRRFDPTLTQLRVSDSPSANGFPREDYLSDAPSQRYIDRGWAGPAWGYYGAGLRALERHVAPVGGEVYAFGYDWRASNQHNGPRLRSFIETMVRDRDGHRYKPIIVTHSMGGLVTRSCISQGGAASISAVIHTFMPT